MGINTLGSSFKNVSGILGGNDPTFTGFPEFFA